MQTGTLLTTRGAEVEIDSEASIKAYGQVVLDVDQDIDELETDLAQLESDAGLHR